MRTQEFHSPIAEKKLSINFRKQRALLRQMIQKKLYIKVGTLFKGANRPSYFSRKKRAKFLIRNYWKRANQKDNSHPRIPTSQLLAIMKNPPPKSSRILDAFYPNRHNEWVSFARRLRKKEDDSISLQNFSLLDNPTTTISTLTRIAKAETNQLNLKLNFDDQYCIDIGAYMILAEMRADMVTFASVSGSMTPAITGMVEAVGLRDDLDIQFIRRKQPDHYFNGFKLRKNISQQNTKNLAFEPSAREKTAEALADDLTNTLQKWIGVGKKLNSDLIDSLKRDVSQLTSEACCNGERHAGLHQNRGNWSVAGFFAPTRNDGGYLNYVCSLGISSHGKTISESMSGAIDQDIISNMNNYLELHKRSGFSQDSLRTIFALQEGNTSTSLEKTMGGAGLMDIIGFAGDLKDLDPTYELSSLGILSGNVYIRFSANEFNHLKYQKQHTPDSLRTLWLNKNNSPNEPPDDGTILEMQTAYPGTLIVLRFSTGNTKSFSAKTL